MSFTKLPLRYKVGILRLTAHLVWCHWEEANVLVAATPTEFLAYTSACDQCVNIMKRWT